MSELTVLDELCLQTDVQAEFDRTGSTAGVMKLIRALEAVGIEPDMPIDRFRSIVEMGKRAEACVVGPWQHHEEAVHCGSGVVLGEEAVWLATWIQTGL